ncbi:hypothetical protein EPO15_07260 [bacterium]|nr:MAG: hypothetical protein EPO15_07260 [bacterium]
MRVWSLALLCAVLAGSPVLAGRSLESLKSAEPLAGAAARLGVDAVPALPAGAPVAAPAPAPDFTVLRVKPDPDKTPGRLCTTDDPDFLEFRYPERIPYCKRHVTKEEKRRVAAAYGIPESEWPNYEFDHLIPLGIGGSSLDENIWPQPRGDDEAEGKDKLELALYKALAAGTITQAEAVRRNMAWFEARGLLLRRPSI